MGILKLALHREAETGNVPGLDFLFYFITAIYEQRVKREFIMKIMNMLKSVCCTTLVSNCQLHTAAATLWVDLLDVISFCFQLPQLIK